MLTEVLFGLSVLVFLAGTHLLAYLIGYERGVGEVSDKDE